MEEIGGNLKSIDCENKKPLMKVIVYFRYKHQYEMPHLICNLEHLKNDTNKSLDNNIKMMDSELQKWTLEKQETDSNFLSTNDKSSYFKQCGAQYFVPINEEEKNKKKKKQEEKKII